MTSNKSTGAEADIQKKLDAIKGKSKHNAQQMANKLSKERNKTKTP